MGVRRIEYRPWKGDRTDPKRRFLVISKNLLRRSLRAKSVIIVLIAGILLAHAFYIIGGIFAPHEELMNKDMVGGETTEFGGQGPPINNKTFIGLEEKGTLWVVGFFSVNGTVLFNGNLTLNGSIEGEGSVELTTDGPLRFGDVSIDGMLDGTGTLQIMGLASGDGNIQGGGGLSGNGTVTGTVTQGQTGDVIVYTSSGYLNSGLLVLFTILLAAIVCSDVISDDLADSSFVLYFSRPVRTVDYLSGKFIGLAWVMGLFCVVPPFFYVLVMLGTQTGSDYGGGLVILGKTILVGILTAVFFLPFGLLLSSMTNRKAYAGIGIFASLFVLTILAQAFREFDAKWLLIDPGNLLHYTYQLTFGGSLPDGLTSGQVATGVLLITLIPIVIVFYLLDRKGAGK